MYNFTSVTGGMEFAALKLYMQEVYEPTSCLVCLARCYFGVTQLWRKFASASVSVRSHQLHWGDWEEALLAVGLQVAVRQLAF